MTTSLHWQKTVLTMCVIGIGVIPTSTYGGVVKIVVATFSPDGTLVGSFDAGTIGQQVITSIDLDSAGNLYVGRMDIQHGGFPNPNDKVVKYSPTGSELLTIKGPMAEPEAVAFDSVGNIYVIGEFEAGDDTAIFKYDPTGNFNTSFATPNSSQPDNWQDLVITSDDRIFAGGDLAGTIAEFSTNGTQANLIGLGVLRRVWGLTLSPDESELWSLDLSNGPGVDRINRYDLDLDFISGIETDLVKGMWDNLQNGSIETTTNGNLLLGAATREVMSKPVVHELSNGNLLNTLVITNVASLVEPGLDQVYVTAFALTPDGNYVFGLSMMSMNVPEPTSAGVLALGGLLCSLWPRPFRKGRFRNQTRQLAASNWSWR